MSCREAAKNSPMALAHLAHPSGDFVPLVRFAAEPPPESLRERRADARRKSEERALISPPREARSPQAMCGEARRDSAEGAQPHLGGAK
jgi:hypothetical protein